jgi:hypothetical protein
MMRRKVQNMLTLLRPRKERLTKEQLEARGLVLAGMVDQEATIAALRAENGRLRTLAEDAGNFCVASDAENISLRAQRDAANALLRECDDELRLLDQDPWVVSLRARIAAHLELSPKEESAET